MEDCWEDCFDACLEDYSKDCLLNCGGLFEVLLKDSVVFTKLIKLRQKTFLLALSWAEFG